MSKKHALLAALPLAVLCLAATPAAASVQRLRVNLNPLVIGTGVGWRF